MLRDRLIVGTLMIVGLVVVMVFDAQLERVPVAGTAWEWLFHGRDRCPAGLLLFLLFAPLVAIAALELCAMLRVKGIEAQPFVVMAGSVAGFAVLYGHTIWPQTALGGLVLPTLLIVVFVLALYIHSFHRQRVEGALAVAAGSLLAVVYLGLMPGFLLVIRVEYGVWTAAAIIVVTKSADSGAYFVGRRFGRHKLVPWLSPKKTWEGLVAAVVVSAMVAVAAVWCLNSFGVAGQWHAAVSIPIVALTGVVLGLLGHLGDLVASLLKRDAGLKDSGQVIRGFGGLIDVFDSAIMVGPVAYWLLWWSSSVA